VGDVARSPAAARPGPDGDGEFKVVVVGGGVAALEAVLCLNDLADNLVSTTIIAPNEEFVCLPTAVQEPFGRPRAQRYRLAQIAEDAQAQLCADSFAWLDSEFSVVHTTAGAQLRYDALLLAPGASVYANQEHVMTLDPRRLDEQLHGLLEDINEGRVQTVAFLIPDGPVWPLPIYELALMTATHAAESAVDVEITIATPEPAPLASFGPAVADHVGQLLIRSGISTIVSTRCAVQGPGRIALHVGQGVRTDLAGPRRELHAERIIALPQLFGPHCPGVPTTAHRGFISTDGHQRVRHMNSTYAAGDATDFPIKFGGISAQQADIAAQSIAALAGAPVQPAPFLPELHAVLLTGGRPLLLDAHLSGTSVARSRVTEFSGPVPRPKLAARYLTPYLKQLDGAAQPRPPVNAVHAP
jgi:sulfide:quinone oxidoreductase